MLIEETAKLDQLDWDKMNALMPAIVQDAFDGRLLMVGYMNRAAAEKTLDTGKVTFFSRSRNTLWTKGETSGNMLELKSMHADCDRDCLLVRAVPHGPTCHLETDTCFDGDGPVTPGLAFLASLDRLVREREQSRPEGSYTTRLFDAGTKRIAQKVGEEGVETALAAATGDRDELLNESADLLYHLLVLLRSTDSSLEEVVDVLRSRHG